ncbi:DEAD-box ATP-dependent RNA helicase 6 [Platanthera guangdongensis]|uniref:DEAD-box ATP-dependent RNA helicase 6 n=1 Tax=Platanthera guangdongensis TaxID=2320717 RepID=A0ABR2LRI1_9ASPA
MHSVATTGVRSSFFLFSARHRRVVSSGLDVGRHTDILGHDILPSIDAGLVRGFVLALSTLFAPLHLSHTSSRVLHAQPTAQPTRFIRKWATDHFAILVPTRDLSLQASQICKELRKHMNVQVMVTTERTSLKDDIKLLYQPAHLIVGTPGQILDQCC